MTTPEERQRAQAETRGLLRELCDPRLTPGVSDRLRHRAEGLLRHLASPAEIRDTLEMALRLHSAEGECDRYGAAARGASRRRFTYIAVSLAVALVAGVLIGAWVPR
jgi:hypothetical protein